ncbi:iron ABC transporter permease [Microbacterium sp.]|uniref:FecCD family ABC transporter permease n=1 Tax=Microbacterium sp. TaxID=51671 RepID=UPI001ACF54FC|nr:iron ABC transporter permease [Microbacterium sp.]MBN9157842.1 iron ABC transporter permease [Microbacterium sp.]
MPPSPPTTAAPPGSVRRPLRRPPRGGGLDAPVPTAAAPGARAPRTSLRILVPLGLAIALAVSVIVAAGAGQLAVPPGEVLGVLLRPLGITALPEPSSDVVSSALWSIRFPRVAMAALVGAALAVAGLLMQAVFGNPLAEPGVVGVSSGAAVGAGVCIVFGIGFLGSWTVPVFAFLTGLAVSLAVYALSRAEGRTEVVTLVLTGIAVNAVAGAAIALLTFLGDTQSREQIVFWQLGSLAGSRWSQAAVVAPLLAIGLVIAFLVAHRLDLLSLGERTARHLGVHVERLRLGTIVLVALLVGAAVAFAGIIAFVGLVVPHLMRMLLGPAHRPLVAASALGGALLLTLADLGARTLVPMADLPLGILTSLVGGPFFFWLLRRTRRSAGGWG